jgi:3-phenylpropionate/trans-cinnamate dioxygenase ferredoxin subunit
LEGLSNPKQELVVHGWLGRETQVHDGWVTVAQLGDLADGQRHAADVLGHPVVLVRFGDEVHTVDGYCPHRGMLLTDAKLKGTAIACIWHGFEYDVRTGDLVWPEAKWAGSCLSVPVYITRVRDGAVEVRVRLAG